MGDEKKDELAGTTALTVPSAQSGSILQQELGPVKPEEVDAYVKVRESSERLSRLKTFITSWEKQQEEERSLRRSYAQYLIIILAVELLLMFAAFFGIGLEWLKVDKWLCRASR